MQTKTRIIATTAVLGTLAFAAPAAAGGTPLNQPVVGFVAAASGATGGTPLNRPVVGFVAAASGASAGGTPLAKPIVGMATSIQSQMNYTPDDATRGIASLAAFPKKLEF